MTTNVLFLLFLSWVAKPLAVHLIYKYTSWTSMQRCRKKITLHQTAHTSKKIISWLPQWKYYSCTQVTNTRVDGIHYEQITLNSRWTVHFYIKYIGLALFSFCNIHLLKQEDSSIQWFRKLKTLKYKWKASYAFLHSNKLLHNPQIINIEMFLSISCIAFVTNQLLVSFNGAIFDIFFSILMSISCLITSKMPFLLFIYKAEPGRK